MDARSKPAGSEPQQRPAGSEPQPGPRARGKTIRPHGWQFSPPACLAREVTARAVGPLLGFVLRGPTVTGAEHLADLEIPAIICPTHASHFDFSAMRLALGPRHRRRLAAAAAADYFTISRKRWFFAAWLGSFAFKRTGQGDDSFAAAAGLLDAGWNVLIFPEGTRSRTGEIAAFHPGAGLLAVRTGRQVLPVKIVGIAAVLPKGGRRPHRAPVEVRFGAPLRALPGEHARDLTARLEAAVRAL
jgi:1-acyl-sn-glycerol-3-phosphate acyltransferase